ncbi:hypothetical protein HRR83_006402 [Exophiala dermatitidis]|uniref:VOC domain-containing protein n=2 Tax=Exophiala dermatitidis TaxID=5970 RepID=H6CA80_EXODN|nr:uncharacterized protein HMPREF1120_08016 [Exophiala dermatitidis NIH/UT8656]KAJ4507412.1 hypothetical protein HRR75_006761 [Exophiala dermatitidis]EHY60044.1 hypothetical protein HMPREF1120_08016 [Exophiala dermatitidis NIH/UT8656]KAJ4509406.1 hypothetical protein HRR73_007260 [Exophiala dermatitidis]KAJ4509593.1 hypothetical protein HRR74_007374 [Exophiala dermatitidis]KAJ4530600.1 hypothetical protein HRR76_008301 [Exophiala dermatitidis]
MGSVSQIDFDSSGEKVVSPSSLAHVVLRTRTANFEKMIEFYTTFLGGTVTYGNSFLSFITYDEEHHRIAIAGLPDTAPKQPASCGLEHIAFSYPTLADLLLAYRQRKARGILPFWSINHGPTTSLYYRDPDGNKLETQVDNFDTAREATIFMESKYFDENPIGTDFDPEDLLSRLRNGESEKELKRRIEIGPRGPDDSGILKNETV